MVAGLLAVASCSPALHGTVRFGAPNSGYWMMHVSNEDSFDWTNSSVEIEGYGVVPVGIVPARSTRTVAVISVPYGVSKVRVRADQGSCTP